MRILHTADWHLNATLGGVSLASQLVASLEYIAFLLEEHRVDVLLVAGDFFVDVPHLEVIENVVSEMERIFSPFIERGGSLLGVAGQDDKDEIFEMFSNALTAAWNDKPGQLVLASEPQYRRVPGTHGQDVQFVLMPYPTPHRYTVAKEEPWIAGDAFLRALEALRFEKIDAQLPRVLVSHLGRDGSMHAKGTRDTSAAQKSVFESADAVANWTYAAYGGSHSPREAPSWLVHGHYAGSLLKLDESEPDEQKSVVVFDIGSTGLDGSPRLLLLPPVVLPPGVNVSDAIQAFLKERFHAHPDRDALLNLAQQLLAEEEEGITKSDVPDTELTDE